VICASALNRGAAASGPFLMLLSLGTKRIGSFDISGLAVSEVVDHCFLIDDPLFGAQATTARVVVNPRTGPGEWAVGESDFGNNVLDEAIPAFRAPSGQSQAPGSAPGIITDPGPNNSTRRSDLRAAAIRVRGADAKGENDCDPGVNTVTVVVKNRGDQAAGTFTVRLSVDGGPSLEEAVTGLAADQEEQVGFEGVDLKKGSHTLEARVDSKNTVSETDEDNNRLQREINCKSE
jgi:hypothetical protein